MNKIHTKKGFTLIELLIVIAILAILAAIVMVAINPSKQFAQARNVQREANVATILNALGQNMVDNKGKLTGNGCDDIDGTETEIGTGTGNLDLETCLAPYLPMGLPVDPLAGTSAATDYTVEKLTNGNYVVCAPEYNEEDALTGLPTDDYCLAR
jgi:prepilin-type N-terminal cleavage/methylation domain-containing protein